MDKPMQANWTPKHPQYLPYWRDWWVYTAVTATTEDEYNSAIQTAQKFEDLCTKNDLKTIHKWEG